MQVIGANKSVIEKTGTLSIDQFVPLAGFSIIQLSQVSPTTKAGIQLNQSQYDATINYIDTKEPVKVLKVGGKSEDSPFQEGDYVILNGGVEGFIFFTTDKGRVCLVDTYSVSMKIVNYVEEEI